MEHFGYTLRVKDLQMLEEVHSHLFDNITVDPEDQAMVDAKEYFELVLADAHIARKYDDERQYRESMDRIFIFKKQTGRSDPGKEIIMSNVKALCSETIELSGQVRGLCMELNILIRSAGGEDMFEDEGPIDIEELTVGMSAADILQFNLDSVILLGGIEAELLQMILELRGLNKMTKKEELLGQVMGLRDSINAKRIEQYGASMFLSVDPTVMLREPTEALESMIRSYAKIIETINGEEL